MLSKYAMYKKSIRSTKTIFIILMQDIDDGQWLNQQILRFNG